MQPDHPPRHRRRRELRQLPGAGPRVLRERRPRRVRARPHARRARWLPHPRHRGRRRLRRRRHEGRPRRRQGHPRRPQQHGEVRRRCPTWACPCCAARPSTASGKYYRQVVEESPGRAGRRGPGPARRPRRRAGLLPPGRLRGGAEALRPGLPRRRRGVRQRHPGVHRLRPRVGGEVRGRRRADRRRRHQEPGRRHHRPPHPGPPVRGPGHGARPHLPAQRGRQHGLHEHARARAAGVQEDLQDPVGHQPDRQRHRGRRRPHRPVGPRGLAGGPQVGLHPPRGPQLRRRPAQRRAQARGVGLAQLGRRHHRRASAAPRSPRTGASAARCSARRPTS